MATGVVKVTDTDMGFRALVASLRRELNGLTVSVGIHGDVPAEADSGASMALIASVHEFGSDHVPARPFIRPTFDEHKEKYWRRIRGALVAAMRRQGGRSLRQNLGLVGEGIQADVRKRIRAGIAPPLSAATIARRIRKRGGSAANASFSGWTALVDDGQLINSIRWKLTVGGVAVDGENGPIPTGSAGGGDDGVTYDRLGRARDRAGRFLGRGNR